MSIPETVDFDKEGQVVRSSHIQKVFLTLLIILVALLSYGLGRLSTEANREPIKLEYGQTATVLNSKEILPPNPILSSGGGVYASSKGKKYYYPWCKSTVSEANKVTFTSPSMAESAGYTLASNCSPR